MYIYVYEILHWASEYQRGIEFNFVRLRHQTIGWCLLPCYMHKSRSVTQCVVGANSSNKSSCLMSLPR